MAHISPPEPAISLHETGFDPEIDLLDSASTGKSLSDLVMRIDDPLVIALDGGWGSGNSFFLKCWVGAHLKEHGETSQTVYLDAFEHDFIDAPLASLMGVVLERVSPTNGDQTKMGASIAKGAVDLLKKSALPLTRLGLAAASYGASEAVSHSHYLHFRAWANSLNSGLINDHEKLNNFDRRLGGRGGATPHFNSSDIY